MSRDREVFDRDVLGNIAAHVHQIKRRVGGIVAYDGHSQPPDMRPFIVELCSEIQRLTRQVLNLADKMGVE